MNYLQRALAIVVLALTLTLSAFAGEIQTPIAPPPPPRVTSEMDCSGVSVDSVTEIALSFIQSVMALF
jgi:hypothetical protein